MPSKKRRHSSRAGSSRDARENLHVHIGCLNLGGVRTIQEEIERRFTEALEDQVRAVYLIDPAFFALYDPVYTLKRWRKGARTTRFQVEMTDERNPTLSSAGILFRDLFGHAIQNNRAFDRSGDRWLHKTSHE